VDMRLAIMVGVLAATYGEPLFGQCSMCRTALAGQGPVVANTLNTAILILLIPAVALFSSVFLLAFRFQVKQTAEEVGMVNDGTSDERTNDSEPDLFGDCTGGARCGGLVSDHRARVSGRH